jgi:hypothetical protein
VEVAPFISTRPLFPAERRDMHRVGRPCVVAARRGQAEPLSWHIISLDTEIRSLTVPFVTAGRAIVPKKANGTPYSHWSARLRSGHPPLTNLERKGRRVKSRNPRCHGGGFSKELHRYRKRRERERDAARQKFQLLR